MNSKWVRIKIVHRYLYFSSFFFLLRIISCFHTEEFYIVELF